MKQSGQSEDSGGKPAVGVVANLPKEEASQPEGDKRRQKEDRREELVNYELNQRIVQTVREGYRVKRLAIAVVISRKHLAESLGGEATPAAQEARLAELKRLVTAATGAKDESEDKVEIVAVDFSANEGVMAPVSGLGVMDYMMMHMGTAMNALAMLGVVFVVVWFGLRPMARMIVQEQPKALEVAPSGGFEMALAPAFDGMGEGPGMLMDDSSSDSQLQLPQRKKNLAMREKLEALVEADSAEVTKVLKGWMQDAKAT